jgi:alpha-L-rhamnosidase
MGMLNPSDWQAKWVGGVYADPNAPERFMPLFRKTFALEGKPVRATAYVAALGYEKLYVNGRPIGDDVCGPPVSDFDKRAYYLTYDVTHAVRQGDNCVGVALGKGWYCETFPGVIPGGPFARVQVEVTLDNGNTVTLASDESWKTHSGPVAALGKTTEGNLKGERIDATAELPGWNTPSFDDSKWDAALVVEPPTPAVVAPMMQPNRIRESITAVSVEPAGPDEYVFDFGRNLTGMFELKLQGNPGQPVSIRYAERGGQEEPGTFMDYHTLDEYIPRSADPEVFRNRFNYHAYRYAFVKGLRRPPTKEDARALFLQTDYEVRGSFQCSNSLLNRIYDTTLYTYRCVCAGGVTVDCPHRERLGYGGDSQITSRTALYAGDLGALYTKWLGNFRDVQNPDTGEIPNIAPAFHGAGGGPTWGGISIALPYDLYLHYGDTRVLRDNYDMMKRYIAFLDSKSKDNLLQPYGNEFYGFIGDWVAPGYDQGGGRPWSPEEWRTFFNNCYCAYANDLVGKIAAVLGEKDDAALYAKKADTIREATHKAYFKPDTNSYVEGGQAYLAFALLSGVTPEALRPAVFENLVKRITETDQGHMNAGMHGSMFLLRYLTDHNRDDLNFLMMNQATYPGWGFIVEKGGTTMWEQWGGDHSHIHSTLLQPGEWFPRGLGGIKTDAEHPGFRRAIIEPHPVGDLTWANTWYDTVRGPVASNWKVDDQKFTLDVEIPANTTALVRIPAAGAEKITESGAPLADNKLIAVAQSENGSVSLEVPSGKYHFEAAK